MSTPSAGGLGPESGAGPGNDPHARGCHALEALRAAPDAPGDDHVTALAAMPADVLDDAVRAFADTHGADAVPVLTRLTGGASPRPVRRSAKRALYRLSQRGVTAAAAPTAARPVVTREPERAVRAWVSAIDGTGARAMWIVFEGGFGGRALCSLIVSDTAGILDTAGGEISKRRLEAELQALRADQKLPWVETDPARAVALVAEALARHAAQGTAPPEAFARWRPLLEGARPPEPLPHLDEIDAARLERSPELLDLPEMAGWFVDPAAVQSDAVELLAARESRLVISDQLKAEREEAIVDAVIEREFTPEARARWARRLLEMALIFEATDRPDLGLTARTAAAALAEGDRDPRHHPFVRLLARRGLEIATDVATGKVSASDVSRAPVPAGTERRPSASG